MSILLNGKLCNKIHFTGILGSGMSALAQFTRWQQMDVTGSDRLLKSEDTAAIKSGLQKIGCCLFSQDGSGIDESTQAVCISTAVENSNPDIAKAISLNIPVIHRSDLLASIIQSHKTIAIAGTSGKSTVTAMVFEFLTSCGKSPSLISGAALLRLEKEGLIGNAFCGTSDLLVVEADESDGTLVKYSPFLSIFLNASKDHKTLEEVIALFKEMASRSSHTICNADDFNLTDIGADIKFGIEKSAQWSPESLNIQNRWGEMTRGAIVYHLPVPGFHNLSNCAAALCTCEYLGCSPIELSEAVKNFQGVSRRFEILSTGDGVYVVDDFAHNPEKIKAAITAARGLSQRLTVIYQPHGFGPTRFLKNEYKEVFRNLLTSNDSLYLLPIYYAGGTAKQDISSGTLIEELGQVDFKACAPCSREDLLKELKGKVSKGDCVLLMGARDPSLSPFALRIAEILGGVSQQ